MKKNQKGFAPIIIVIIVFAAIAFVVIQNRTFTQPSSVTTPITDDAKNVDTSSWKSYTSNMFGFNFKYPSSFDFFQELPLRTEDLEDDVPSTVLETASKKDDFYLRIRIIKTDSTPQEWVENNDCPVVKGEPSCIAKEGSLPNSVQFKPIETEDSLVTNPRFVYTYINYQGHLYEFLSTKSGGATSTITEDTVSLHNQILSTFKFTN